MELVVWFHIISGIIFLVVLIRVILEVREEKRKKELAEEHLRQYPMAPEDCYHYAEGKGKMFRVGLDPHKNIKDIDVIYTEITKEGEISYSFDNEKCTTTLNKNKNGKDS